MTLQREAAWEHLCLWTKGDSLRKHALAVEMVMRAAHDLHSGGTDSVEAWGIAGMLHDADYEAWPEEHPRRIVAWLQEQGEEAIAHAVSAHYTQWGVPYNSPMDKALLACDELTGFVMACSLVRPEGVSTLSPKSVVKKLKDKRFAASVERSEVQAGIDTLGVERNAHIQMVIDALKPHAAALGIGPKGER